MSEIHFGLPVLMTFDAGEVFAVGRIAMARKAIIPGTGVRACEDGKELSVMVPELALLTSGVANEALVALPTETGNAVVLQIHFSLPVLVALDAGEVLAVGGVRMARKAIIPGTGVRACEDWEELGVVVSELAFLTSGVTYEAFAALPTVAGNAVMFQIHFGLPVLVALDAGEVFAVGRIGMACKAVIPFVGMLTGKNRKVEIVVVPEFALLT